MAVVIRMKRTGRKNRPCYRISVADSRFPRDGRTLENLGLYDPIAPREEARLSLNVERAKHWIGVGAKPSETVNSIFKRSEVYADRPAPTRRKRTGRKRSTATHQRREARRKTLDEAKVARARDRATAKKAASESE